MHVELKALGEIVRLDHDAVSAIIAVQPNAFAEPITSMARWARVQGSFLCGEAHHDSRRELASRPQHGKPRGLVAFGRGLRYNLRACEGGLSPRPRHCQG